MLNASEINDGEIALRSVQGQVKLYTKHNGALYSTFLDKDLPASNMTELEKIKKNLPEKVQESKPKQIVNIYGTSPVTIAGRYYRGTGALNSDWSTARLSMNFSSYQQSQCNFIAPTAMTVRSIKLFYYYDNNAMDDATGDINIRKSAAPANGATSTIITTEMTTIDFVGSGMNHNTTYMQRAVPGKNLPDSYLAEGDGITVFVRRSDQSAANIHIGIALEMEYI